MEIKDDVRNVMSEMYGVELDDDGSKMMAEIVQRCVFDGKSIFDALVATAGMFGVSPEICTQRMDYAARCAGYVVLRKDGADDHLWVWQGLVMAVCDSIKSGKRGAVYTLFSDGRLVKPSDDQS